MRENCNKRVLLVWQPSASGHIHKWTKSPIFERNGRLACSLICQMCGDYHRCGPDLTIRNGQNFMMPCPLGLSQWELVSQGTRLDLLWLYQSWLLGCCWLISILGSFLVRSASEDFQPLSQWNTLKTRLIWEGTLRDLQPHPVTDFGLGMWTMTLNNIKLDI